MKKTLPNSIQPFSDEQSRSLINLRQQYEVWIEAARSLAALPYHLRWKTIGGKDYLYQDRNRRGSGSSLGPRSPETEAIHAQYVADKADARGRLEGTETQLDVTCRVYRALRLPLVPAPAAAILREADRQGLLGTHLMVVGTNAIPAYSIEANGHIRGMPDETLDFDLAWIGQATAGEGPPVWSLLKSVDDTYTVNTERSFQARNATAYEVELLVAPSRVAGMHRLEQPRPVPMHEQEWLLRGRPVDHTLVGRDGSPARLVVPDPRWFALHKLWLAAQPKRDSLKRAKDATQGALLLTAVATVMPQYPLDAGFETDLPKELAPIYADWRATHSAVSAKRSW